MICTVLHLATESVFSLVPETGDDESPVSDGDSEVPEVMEENPKDDEKEEAESNHTEL